MTGSSAQAHSAERRYRLPGLDIAEHTVEVPLDHSGEAPGRIEVFARVVGAAGSAKPYLLYLQGGPGHEAFRPSMTDPPWLARALRDYRVVMLDQRGTGRSTPIGIVGDQVTGVPEALAAAPRDDAAAGRLADHLAFYRADAIVEDAEAVRRLLGVRTWSVLGQSFGGFTTLRYLHAHPESVSAALFTGGLPAVDRTPAEVYARTWRTMIAKSRRFAAAFPEAAERLRVLSARAAADGIGLPGGVVARPAHVRLLGHLLGASGGDVRLQYLLESDVDSAALRHDLASAQPFTGRNPLYAVLHESCWANGARTGWAAQSAMPDEVGTDPALLAGEHISPEIFASGELAAWESTAHALADRRWPELWDPRRLAAADVPAAAAVYFDDAYVPCDFSLATAEMLPRMRTWVTNEYEHNGLRASGGRVLDRLIGMVRGEI